MSSFEAGPSAALCCAKLIDAKSKHARTAKAKRFIIDLQGLRTISRNYLNDIARREVTLTRRAQEVTGVCRVASECNAWAWAQLPADGDPKSRLRGCSWPFRNPASIPDNPWGKRLRTIRRTCSAKYRT